MMKIIIKKVNEIISRPIKTWSEYSQEMLNSMREIDEVHIKNEIIYYWLDATVQIDRNSGIQRVCRQLAKSLIENGRKLVPIKWNDNSEKIDVASEIDLELMSKWNGPKRWMVYTANFVR